MPFGEHALSAVVGEPGGNIAAELTAFDERSIDRLVDGSRAHARRRTDEMSAVTDQLRELGVPGRIAPAARDLLADLAAGEKK